MCFLLELINTHCHSKYCGHGEGEIEEYVIDAEEAGLTTLAFTEHYPLSSDFDPDEYLSVPASSMTAYRDAVEEARKAYPDLTIILGLEMDYLGDDEDRNITADDLAPFELILGSVHFVDKWAFDDPSQRERWDEPGAADAIWSRYFELWCQAAADKNQPFDVMSHPDLAKKFAFYPSYDLKPLYEQAAEAAKAGGRMIEVNTSGSYYACAEMFPAPDLLQAFCKAGIPCTVGTDAHVPKNVARDIERAYALMYDAGYRVVTVSTSTGDRRTITIE